jgi:hypothetical protein
MPRSILFVPCRLTLLAAFAAVLAGCGSSTYEAAYEKQFKRLKHGAPFQLLFDNPTQIPDTSVSIRIPALFKDSYTLTSADPKDMSKVIDPARIQPPFLPLPGFKLCFEATAAPKSGGGQAVPYYCYLAAAPGDGRAIEADLLDKLKAAFPGTNAAWEVVSCDSPTEGSVAWRRIRIQADQRFDIPAWNGPVQQKELPATFDLWHFEGPGVQILMGFRIPDAIKSDIPLCEPPETALDQLAAGTLVVGVAAAPAAAEPAKK